MTSWPHIPILFTETELTGLNSLPFPSNCILTHTGLAFSVFLQHEAVPTLPQSPVCSPISRMGQTEAEKGHVGEQRSPGQTRFRDAKVTGYCFQTPIQAAPSCGGMAAGG